MGTFTALLVTTIITAQVSANGHEEGNSVTEMVSFMKENFRELFQRLDRLESKVNRIIGKENCQPGKIGSGGREIQGEDRPDGFNATGAVATSGLNESHIQASMKEVNRLHGIISELVTAPECQKNVAYVPQPVVVAAVNSPKNFSCESNGHPIKSCLWGHSRNGTPEAIIVDQQVVENGGRTNADGVTLFANSDDLDAGKCAISIESVKEEHAGLWSCMLISENSTLFSGAVQVNIEPNIFFVTWEGVVSAYSLETKEVKNIVNSTDNLLAIAYDSIHNKLLWSNHDGKIYRANKNGSELETVFDTVQYGNFWGLAFDWIGGNIYGATYDGYILACSVSSTPTISCNPVLDGQEGAIGIALNPVEGTMYWTRYLPGSLHKAGMDGSSPTTLQTDLYLPRGLTIDFAARRLYWTEYMKHRIQTSDMEGQDIRTAVQLPLGTGPQGLALSSDRIYWGQVGDNKLQSSTKDGQDIQTLYTERSDVRHVILVPMWNQPTNGTDFC